MGVEERDSIDIDADEGDRYANDVEDALDGDVPADYDVTASPNDFNVITIFNFMESGSIVIPPFQRNYVWDLRRASKLIESLIIGLPIPQVFLYEEERNKLLVIDGQQRLMSIYYFMKGRFPRRDQRSALRKVFDEENRIPEEVLGDDAYFSNFRLALPEQLPERPNRFNRLSHPTLPAEHRVAFELRTIRNVIIKDNSPVRDGSAMYEIFYRLNTGGVNLRPQEIRMSLYHSGFYDVLLRLNLDARWRRFTKSPEPDIHMKDVEILLRAYGMLIRGDDYEAPMTRFLNGFSFYCRNFSDAELERLQRLFNSFLASCSELPDGAFDTARARLNITLFEAVFAAACRDAFLAGDELRRAISLDQIQRIQDNQEFARATLEGSASKANVLKRLEIARSIFGESGA